VLSCLSSFKFLDVTLRVAITEFSGLLIQREMLISSSCLLILRILERLLFALSKSWLATTLRVALGLGFLLVWWLCVLRT